MSDTTPILDGRSSDDILRDLRALVPGYVPNWLLSDVESGDAGWALAQIFARYVEVLGERLNRAPDKAKLAFLDWLGMSLIPAQAARAPVVFQLLPNARDSRAPEQTQIGAKVAGDNNPLIFQTETTIGLAAASLAQVVTLHPGRDASADHSADSMDKQVFTLFARLQPTPHILYLAHNLHFVLSGHSTVEVILELAEAGEHRLNIAWEYWDGEVWREFKPFADEDVHGESFDSTRGLTRNGIVRLVSEAAETLSVNVNGIQSYWVRGRLGNLLSPAAGTALPIVNRVHVRTVIDRSLPSADCTAGIMPEIAFADAQKLDLSKAFQPLGQNPQIGSAFYVSCEEAFSKPGAEVVLCLTRPVLPQEKVDQKMAEYEVHLQSAQDHIKKIKTAVEGVITLLQVLPTGDLRNEPQPLFDEDMNKWYSDRRVKVNAARDMIVRQLPNAAVVLGGLATPAPLGFIPAMTNALIGIITAAQTLSDTTFAIVTPPNIPDANQVAVNRLEELRRDLDTALTQPSPELAIKIAGHLVAVGTMNMNAIVAAWPIFLETSLSGLTTAEARYQGLKDRINRSRAVVNSAIASANQVVTMLSDLSPVVMATAAGVPPPVLPAPVLAWEYWDRSQWRTIPGLSDSLKFQTSGQLEFTVPDDWGTTTVNQVEGRWLRSRLAAGSYGKLRIVTWKDGDDNVNALPIIESRPPTLEAFSLGYAYRSPKAAPEHCLTYNDFEYEDASDAAAWAGQTFTPYHPITDLTPALYLGFDKPLPAERVSLYLDIREQEDKTSGAPLIWEYWDGLVWQEITLEDETAHLRLPGMLAFIGAADSAPLARFGVPYHWLRGRLRGDGEPVDSTVNAIYPNAVWASQRQTLNHELLGSSNGQAKQSFFFSHSPVLVGEVIEVLELEGARAEVELPMLQRELQRMGYRQSELDALLRIVTDRRDGRIREVWVRWEEKPHLLFSRAIDRHYMIERSSGRLLFGDGSHGRIPSVGMNNIVAQTYCAGGGVAGNVPAGAINQLLGMVSSAQGVTNPRQAEGGANGETLESIHTRGPRSVRNHAQAVRLADYETLAREASPAVAISRAMKLAPGRINLIVVPNSADPRPQPSFELRRQVQAYLSLRAPAAVAGQITVRGPDYLPVGVEVTVAPINTEDAGFVRERVWAALDYFLHPLTGGPEQSGWAFGRDVYISDLAAILENLEGVDYCESITLLLDDAPQGNRVFVPSDRIVVAGSLRVLVRAAEQQ